ncbi:hypothetical protein [Streptomyces sp. FIT100]|uniref:hypothetical protein n=1 Tax=Streptomyces sp. FIT100 TaxID=2837956 RepID=UPI0021C5DC88|nr:hypothetical protein [Streptomyces sp. FIT100]UUN28023.1 hypothetical protein KK483_17745 [Streptomyces sp. FIT100]
MPSASFPHDLIQLQRAWNRTYEALATPRARDVTALRRQLLQLSTRLFWHPYFEAPPNGRPATGAELRRQARGSAPSRRRT